MSWASRRFITRYRGGHRDAAVEAEAQRAYREVLDEARLERIRELERLVADMRTEVIQLRAKLRVAEHVAETPAWMAHGSRRRQRLDDGPTSVLPGALFRRTR